MKNVGPEDYLEIPSRIRHTLAPWHGYSIIMNMSETLDKSNNNKTTK